MLMIIKMLCYANDNDNDNANANENDKYIIC
jgi:hypothetical protein